MPVQPDPLLTEVVAAACWSIAVLTWVGTALREVRHSRPTRSRTPFGQGSLIALIAACAVIVLLTRRYARHLRVPALWVHVVGLVVLAASTAMAVWARIWLGSMWNFGSHVRDHHELRTTGPYGVTRHPIYTGLLGMLLGTALSNGLGTWLFLFPLGLVLLGFKARQEERLLLAEFPDQYPDYRRSVPQLVPGLSYLRRGPGNPVE